MAQQFGNNAEGGTNGAVVTTGNSGGASGDAFSIVVIAADGTLIFDTSTSAHGSFSYQFGSVTSAPTYVRWTYSVATSTIAIRLCMKAFTPPVNLDFLTVFSGTTRRLSLRMNTTRKLSVVNSVNTAQGTHATAPTSGTWIRIEAQFVLSATAGTFTLNRYDSMDSTTPTETSSGSTANFGGTTADNVRIGIPTAAASMGPYNADDLAVNDTGTAIGPAAVAANVAPPAGAAVADATAPAVSAAASLAPPAGVATGAATAPAVTAPANLSPPAGNATGTAKGPTVAAASSIAPPAGAATAGSTAPIVTAAASLAPPAGAAVAAATPPAVSAAVSLAIPAAVATAAAAPPSFTGLAALFPPAGAATASATPPVVTIVVPVITPPERIYAVTAEHRVYLVAAESRVLTVPSESRIYTLEA